MDWLNDDQRALRDMAEFSHARKSSRSPTRSISRSTPPTNWSPRRRRSACSGSIPRRNMAGRVPIWSRCAWSVEELAKASPSFAGMLTVQMVLCPRTVEILGTEEQKQRILPRNASGERLMAYSQSEPAGAANIAHHHPGVPEADGYRLDGSKLFCTQGTAGTWLVMAKTRDRTGNEGYGCVIVEREDRASTSRRTSTSSAGAAPIRGRSPSTTCIVAEDDMLGDLLTGGVLAPPGEPRQPARPRRDVGRLRAGSVRQDHRLCQGTPALRQGHGRTAAGRLLAGRSHAKIAACRALLYDTVRKFEAGRSNEAGNICKALSARPPSMSASNCCSCGAAAAS